MNEKKRGKGMFIFICILIFIVSFIIGVVTKFSITPTWMDKYSVNWSDEIGTKITDISYGEGELNKFDLYLPKDNSNDNYGLVVYLHAGGFTSGDKSDDESILAWLTSKGYVTAGINYTLRTENNDATVYSQSLEVKQAIPVVIEEARKQGYNIDKMAMAGGSAGHCLAMIYAYRDVNESPVSLKMTFGAVGPSCFYVEDWINMGGNPNNPIQYDPNTDYSGIAGLFSVMSGNEITDEMFKTGEYLELVKNISAEMWIDENSVPTVVAYGSWDRVQTFRASLKLKDTLEKNGVDYKYFELKHSGHGLQNDNAVYKEYYETVEQYLDKYMPID